MQPLRWFRVGLSSSIAGSTCQCRQYSHRNLASVSTTSSPPRPWFVDPSEAEFLSRPPPPHLPLSDTRPAFHPPLPDGLPIIIQRLHSVLSTSPHIEPGTLIVRDPPEIQGGPSLPETPRKGRRRLRGGTYFGEGVDIGDGAFGGGLWKWVVMAQVKDGTENKGAIESVVRVVRKSLLTGDPAVPLPPNSKRRIHHGWAMVDGGDFAVHILSKQTLERYFDGFNQW